MTLAALGLLAAFSAVLLVVLTTWSLVAERREVYKSLRALQTIELSTTDLRRRQLAIPMTSRLLRPTLERLSGLVRRFTPASAIERLQHEIELAGSPAGWDAERFLAWKLLSAVGVTLVGLGVFAVVGLPPVRGIVLVAIMAALGFYIPEWILRSHSSTRQDTIRRELPDALDLLSITVEAGLGFDAALQRVANNSKGPLGAEFHRVVKEMQLGKSRPDALRELGQRTSVPELRSFVMAMIQADQFGVSIAQVLHVQADELRIKRRQRAEEKAAKVPIKILFPLLFGIFPALFIVIIGPGAIQVYEALLR